VGRRRRRKEVKIIKRKLPKYFICPKCGGRSVEVRVNEPGTLARVQCSGCGLIGENIPVFKSDQHVDVYCRFNDLFYSGKIG